MTPQERRNARAQSMGYRNDYEYRKFSAGDEKYFRSWLRSNQGTSIEKHAREIAKQRGETFRRSDFKVDLIAARNSRPSSVRPAGQAYTNFNSKYGLAPGQDWVRY
jgi:hypothetical protein